MNLDLKKVIPINNTEAIARLNTHDVKRAVREIILENTGLLFKLSQITISDKYYRTYINNKNALYFDRHCHYTDPKDYLIGVFLYLQTCQQCFTSKYVVQFT